MWFYAMKLERVHKSGGIIIRRDEQGTQKEENTCDMKHKKALLLQWCMLVLYIDCKSRLKSDEHCLPATHVYVSGVKNYSLILKIEIKGRLHFLSLKFPGFNSPLW